MEKLNFPFVQKEGKYFASIVSTQTKYKVENGAVVEDGEKIVSGVKGVRMRVRMTLPASAASSRAELFALNTEVVHSSN